MFKSFDTSGDGFICFNEFLNAVKGPLNSFRQQIIIRVFKQLDFN